MAGGTRVGRMKAGKTGELHIDLTVAGETDVELLLCALREAILSARNVRTDEAA